MAFDYSLCNTPNTQFFVEQNTYNRFQQWSQITNNTEINQYAPTETFTSSTGETPERINARKLALCYACKQYVYMYCEMIKEINADAAAAGNISALAIAAVVALGTAGAIFTFGTSTLAAMAIAGAIGGLGLAVYSSLTDAVLEDTVAKDAVACLMYQTLKDLEPTAENFAAAVNSGTLTGNAELIRATLAVDISNAAGLENQFNAFINLLGDSLRPAELGLIDDCPCDAPPLTPVLAPASLWVNCYGTFTETCVGSITQVAGTTDQWDIQTAVCNGAHRWYIKDIDNRQFRYEFISTESGADIHSMSTVFSTGVCHHYQGVGWQDWNQYIVALMAARQEVSSVYRIRMF